MRIRLTSTLTPIMGALAMGLAFGAVAPRVSAQAPASVVVPGRIDIGTVVPDIAISNADGSVSIATNAAPATVVIFISSRCPVSMAYNGRMKALYDDYLGKQVQFVFVSPNNVESFDELERLRGKENWAFPVYKDVDYVLADRFGARVTPEVFVFNRQGALTYRGNIDDSQQEGEIKTQALRTALDAMLAGKTVDVATTNPFGCSIKRKRAS